MKKSLVIALAVIILAGSGIVFAEYAPYETLFGVNAENLSSETEQSAENDEAIENNSENERLEVSEAVHNALSDNALTPKDGNAFGKVVSDQAKDESIDLGQIVSDAAREAAREQNRQNNNGASAEERSEVAEAVHEVLGGGESTPGDGNEFGEKVSEQAREKGAEFGQEVSDAARNANGSSSAGNRGNSGNARPQGAGKPGN